MYYREALTLAEPRGMRPLVLNATSASASKLYRRTGKRGQAQEHFAATTLYREMGMTYWPENVEREIEELENDV
jgi:hypothetical protein